MLAKMSVGIAVLAMTASFAIGVASTASASPELRHEVRHAPPMRPPVTTHRRPNLGAINNNLILIRDNAGKPNPALQDASDDDDVDAKLTKLKDRDRELEMQIIGLEDELRTLMRAFLNSDAGDEAIDRIDRETEARDQQKDEVTEAYDAMMAAADAANQVNGGAGNAIAQAATDYLDNALEEIDDDYDFATDEIIGYEMELNDPETAEKFHELKAKIQFAEEEREAGHSEYSKLSKLNEAAPGK